MEKIKITGFVALILVLNHINASDISIKINNPINSTCNGKINLTVLGGFPLYDIKWTDPNGVIKQVGGVNGSDGQEDIDNLCPNVQYCVSITDALCGVLNYCWTLPDCSYFNVNGNFMVTDATACNLSNGMIFVNGLTFQGGSPPYNYCLEDINKNKLYFNQFNQVLNLKPGKYIFIANDIKGCEFIKELHVSWPNGFNIVLTPNCTDRINAYVLYNGREIRGVFHKFEWSNGITTIGEYSSEILINSIGTYCVKVTSLFDNCVLENCIEITNSQEFKFELEGIVDDLKKLKCSGLIDLTIKHNDQSKVFHVNWTGPNNYRQRSRSNGNNGNEDIFNLCSGTYCVTVSPADCNNNIVTKCFNVESCDEIYDVTGIPIITNPSNCSASDGALGVRFLKIEKNGKYCQSCFFEVEDIDGNKYVNTNGEFKNLKSGVYFIKGVSPLGCKINPLKVYLKAINGFDYDVSIVNPCPSVDNGSIEIVSGSFFGDDYFDYFWDNGVNFLNVPAHEPIKLLNLNPGKYCVTIKGKTSNCLVKDCFDLTSDLLKGNLNVTGKIYNPCNDSNNGGIELSTTGGYPPYRYQWSDGKSEVNNSFLGEGSYCVTITDYCENQIFECFELKKLSVDLETGIYCFYDGYASLNIQGGNEPINIYWSTNESTKKIIDLKEGRHSVRVVDGSGCTLSEIFDLNYKRKAIIKRHKNVSLCSYDSYTCDGLIELEQVENVYKGININLTYEWTGPNGFRSTQKNIYNLCPGDYTVKVKTNLGKGCIEELYHTICCCTLEGNNYQACDKLSEPEIDFSAESKSPLFINSNDGWIKLIGNNFEKYFFRWTGPNNYSSNEPDLTGLKEGTYCVTVTGICKSKKLCIDLFSCESKNIKLIGNILNTCSGYSAGSIDLLISSNSKYTYLWSNNQNTKSIDRLPQGNYTVTVTDDQGCTASESFEVLASGQITSEDKTKPCAKFYYCGEKEVYRVAYEVICDEPESSDCLRKKCKCSLTNSRTDDMILKYTEITIDNNCNVSGTCPNGNKVDLGMGSPGRYYKNYNSETFKCVYEKYCYFDYNNVRYFSEKEEEFEFRSCTLKNPIITCSYPPSTCEADCYCGSVSVGKGCIPCNAFIDDENKINSRFNNKSNDSNFLISKLIWDPSNYVFKIYYKNNKDFSINLKIYNIMGQFINSFDTELLASNDFITIPAKLDLRGYFYILMFDSTGKIITSIPIII
ncbi:MAG: hypothetical protein HOP11_13655 [Saprospiraceae bacterium]|nr:hypothetical protein [Saprospiraceae bacterium]